MAIDIRGYKISIYVFRKHLFMRSPVVSVPSVRDVNVSPDFWEDFGRDFRENLHHPCVCLGELPHVCMLHLDSDRLPIG